MCTVNKFSLTSLPSHVYGQQVLGMRPLYRQTVVIRYCMSKSGACLFRGGGKRSQGRWDGGHCFPLEMKYFISCSFSFQEIQRNNGYEGPPKFPHLPVSTVYMTVKAAGCECLHLIKINSLAL